MSNFLDTKCPFCHHKHQYQDYCGCEKKCYKCKHVHSGYNCEYILSKDTKYEKVKQQVPKKEYYDEIVEKPSWTESYEEIVSERVESRKQIWISHYVGGTDCGHHEYVSEYNYVPKTHTRYRYHQPTKETVRRERIVGYQEIEVEVPKHENIKRCMCTEDITCHCNAKRGLFWNTPPNRTQQSKWPLRIS